MGSLLLALMISTAAPADPPVSGDADPRPAPVTGDVSIEPVTALAIAAGGGAGAVAGLVGGAILAVSYPEGTDGIVVTGTLLGGTGLGAALGGATVALFMSPAHALLTATTAFAAAPMGMLGGGALAILFTAFAIVTGDKLAVAALGPLIVVGVLGGAVAGGAWGAVVGAGLPQE